MVDALENYTIEGLTTNIDMHLEVLAEQAETLRAEGRTAMFVAVDGKPAGLVAVADPELRTGYVYANPGEHAVRRTDGDYVVDGERAAAADLPLEPVLAFDAMWFAWAGYYPETAYVA